MFEILQKIPWLSICRYRLGLGSVLDKILFPRISDSDIVSRKVYRVLYLKCIKIQIYKAISIKNQDTRYFFQGSKGKGRDTQGLVHTLVPEILKTALVVDLQFVRFHFI